MRIKRGRKNIVDKVKLSHYKRTKRVKPIIVESIQEGGINMACEAMSPIDNRTAFVVRADKVQDFLNLRPNKEKINEIMKRAERFEKNIVHED